MSNNAQKVRASGLFVASASGITQLTNPTNKVTVSNTNATTTYSIIPLNYKFSGKGYGHGLGMSQYGAKGMADAGFDYKQILEYYFTGSKVQ
jgi:stage II sporulation protein D